jgi:predicted nuclease of predicted toxin-antitoxin system
MKPPWLLNENFPRPAIAKLRAAGWDVIAVGELEASATDPRVMARARAEGRWLATFDRDYGELVFRRGLAPPPLILLLRVTSYLPAEPAGWIESLYASGELKPGSFHVYDGQTIRRRPLLTDLGEPRG